MNALTHEDCHNKGWRIQAEGVFEAMDPEALERLEKLGVYMAYDDEPVVEDGQAQEYFFSVVKGFFEVSKVDSETKSKNVLGTIRAGECFGEMSFLMQTPASAKIYAFEQVVAWAIPHKLLRKFIISDVMGAQLALNISSLIASRLMQGNQRLMGVSTALHSYFGHVARHAELKVAAKGGMGVLAEMEIPKEVYEGIALQVLGMESTGTLTPEKLAQVRAKIFSGEVEVVPWLELGDGGFTLKLKLNRK